MPPSTYKEMQDAPKLQPSISSALPMAGRRHHPDPKDKHP
jgi:hypothetical protein